MAFSLRNLFSKNTTSTAPANGATFGIDIGSSSVKVVEIERTEEALILRTYGELQLGPYNEKELGMGVSLTKKQKVSAVVDVIREAQVGVKHGALAMPLSSSFLTVMPVTVGAGQELSSRITIEAKKYVPLPLADVTLDWSVLNPVDKEKTSVEEVLLAAIENKALSEYQALLHEIGMTGEPAEIEAFSTVRSLVKPKVSTSAIVDIGAKTAKLYIVRDGNLERIHRVATGGEMITKRTAELLQISFAEAENKKRAYQKSDPSARDLYNAMSSVIESPLQEFARLIQHYETRLGAPIDEIQCTGGVASSPYFVPYTKTLLAHEQVHLANPFTKVAYPAFMEDTLTAIAPSFSASMGAALRGLQS